MTTTSKACEAVHTQIIESSLGQPGKQLAKFEAVTTWHDTYTQAAARRESVEDRAFARVFTQKGSALGDYRAVTWVEVRS
jgi:hypothetical protein